MAARHYSEDDLILTNRASKPADAPQELFASQFKTFPVLHKFVSSEWSPRSELIVGYDARGNIVEASMESPHVELQDKFESACENKDLYQVKIADTDIVASVDPCAYSVHGGLNETWVLTTIDGKSIAAMHYQKLDLKYLANREKSAKRRRLMLTPDYTEWRTNVTTRPLNKDISAPFFYDGLKNYNNLGGEKVIKKAPGEKGAEPPEQSFFQKYWLYIMMAMFILPRLLGEEPPQEGEAAAQGDQPAQAAPSSRR